MTQVGTTNNPQNMWAQLAIAAGGLLGTLFGGRGGRGGTAQQQQQFAAFQALQAQRSQQTLIYAVIALIVLGGLFFAIFNPDQKPKRKARKRRTTSARGRSVRSRAKRGRARTSVRRGVGPKKSKTEIRAQRLRNLEKARRARRRNLKAAKK